MPKSALAGVDEPRYNRAPMCIPVQHQCNLKCNCALPDTDMLKLLQEPFLRATVVHYAAEGQRYMATTDVAEYLLHCEASDFLFCPFMLLASCFAFLAS